MMVMYLGIKLVFRNKPFPLTFDLFPFLRDNLNWNNCIYAEKTKNIYETTYETYNKLMTENI